MNILKSIVLSLLVFIFIGPFVGSLVVLGIAGEFQLGIIVWGYFFGLLPALIACVFNYVLFLILPTKLKSYNYATGFISGAILSLLSIIREEMYYHMDKVFFTFAILIIPATICGVIVNSHLSRWLNSDQQFKSTFT